MNVAPADLAELSDVNIELVPQVWLRRKPIVKRIASALRAVEDGYVKHPFSRSAVRLSLAFIESCTTL